MRRVDTVFADHGIRTIRHYRPGRAPQGECVCWRGSCVEVRSTSELEHAFADGLDLLRDPPVGLVAEVADQVRVVLATPPADPVGAAAAELDHVLADLAERHRVLLTWAGFGQQVAVGSSAGSAGSGPGRLALDERVVATVEVVDVTDPACSDVVCWDGDDPAGSLQRVVAAVGAVRELATLPVVDLLPSGCDVVLEPGRAGPFFHELVGHPLEADLVATGSSYLAGRLGEQVAPAWLSVTDGAAAPGQGLSARIDDEGETVTTVSLIEAGRVAGVLSDLTAAASVGSAVSVGGGHGRRLDYRHPVLPRMWHTTARAVGAEPEPPGSVRLGLRGLRLRWMNLLTGHFEFAVGTGVLDTGDGVPRRVAPIALVGNASDVLAALRPGSPQVRGGGRASKGCGKLGQFPLVTTFANGGVWIPAAAVEVRRDAHG